MTISTQDLREAAADVAVRVAQMATESDEGFNALVLRSTFMALLEARVPTARAEPVAEPPPADPNAEGEALAAAIVASARLADSQAAGTSEEEALAAEIVAAAGQAGGKGRG